MLLHRGEHREGPSAHFALVPVFARMQPLVPAKARSVGESSGANRTHKRFLSGVDASMRQQMRFRDERFFAEFALVGSLSGMDAFMRHESRARRETFAAYLAHVRPFAGVYPHVLLQAARIHKIVQTHPAFEPFDHGPVGTVRAFVFYERGTIAKRSGADRTLVRTLSGVSSFVRHQMRAGGENFCAHVAFARLGISMAFVVVHQRRRRSKTFTAYSARQSRVQHFKFAVLARHFMARSFGNIVQSSIHGISVVGHRTLKLRRKFVFYEQVAPVGGDKLGRIRFTEIRKIYENLSIEQTSRRFFGTPCTWVVLQKLPQLSDPHFSRVLNNFEKNFFMIL